MDGRIGDDKGGMFAARRGTAEGGVTKRILWMGRGAERKDYIRAEKAKEKKGKIIQNRKIAKLKLSSRKDTNQLSGPDISVKTIEK